MWNLVWNGIMEGLGIWLDIFNVIYSNWCGGQVIVVFDICGYIGRGFFFEWVVLDCVQIFVFVCEF